MTQSGEDDARASASASSSSTAAAAAAARETASPFGNLARFSFCASGICLCYWFYGIMQENLLSNSGLGATFVLVAQAFANVCVSTIWKKLQSMLQSNGDDAKRSTSSTPDPSMTKKSLNHALLITTSAFYVFAMIGSNEALRFVSYPTAVLAKSCKLLPTMIMGTIIERRVYSKQQWTSALAISVGMSLFHISRLQQTSTTKSTASSGDNSTSEGDGSDVNTDDEEDGDHSWKGMALLIWSLTCDGFLGSCQGLLKRVDTKGNQRPPSAVETMLYMNIYALFFLIPVAMISGQWQQGVHLLQSDGQLRMAIFILNLVVSVGQIFIFLTVTWYSSLACTTITTTRKFITILLSVIYFGHKFSMMQWCAVGLVFGGLYLATVSKQFAGTPRQVTAEDADKTKKMQ